MAEATQEKEISIVMADDNLNDHDLTLRALRSCGVKHVFHSVYNGAQLMDFLLKRGIYSDDNEGLPDAILMDLNMRVQDGFDTLKQIKTNTALKHIPIYVLTASNYHKDENQVKALGVTGFYTKPILYEQTQELLRKICAEIKGN